MTGILSMLIGQIYGGSTPVITDPYFDYTTLLIPGNGTNGAQNNTFLDSSTNNFTITRNGNTTQGTFSPFSQTGWGNYFDGTGDCLSIPTSAISAVGSNNFSMECWVYPLRQTNTYSQGLISYGVSGSVSGTSYISFELSSSGYAAVAFAQVIGLTITSSTITPINQWSHIVVCRSGSTLSIFLNGTRVATTSTSATVGSSGNVLFIGSSWYANEATRNLQGYISNARIVNGASAYDATQSTITVPTSPLTAISSTSLLTCQSNRFVDNSASPLTITVNGNTSVQAFSPFNPSASWSAATYGGSGYFDGNTDYLTVPQSAGALDLGSGQFSLEFWWYPTSAATGQYPFIGESTGDWYVGVENNNIGLGRRGVTVDVNTTGFTLTANTWQHFVIARQSTGSNDTRIFVNGVLNGVGTTSQNYTIATTLRIGGQTGGSINGYLSSTNLVKGSVPAAYQTSSTTTGTQIFTPPTSPSTSVTGTQLLLNYTNAGIYDATSKNDLETVGNAQISTAQSKWGGSSMAFDGTGDYVTSYNANALFRIGNIYTIELWFYTTTIAAGTAGLICLATGAATNSGINIYRFGSEIICNDGTTGGTGPSSGSSAITANTWAHLAVVSDGTTTKMYIDGVLKGTYSGTTASSAALTYVTVGANGDKSSVLNGYIQDVRITKGYARYTANFTAPTAAFPTL